jgi:enterochelin esterase-like enzyme
LKITESIIHSPLLGNERRVWLQVPPDDQSTAGICILLDGEYYVERMDAPAVIDELQRSPTVPPFAVAYVSHVDHATRSKESTCNNRFARFAAEELAPWVNRQCGPSAENLPTILGGLSLTGLAAAHAVLRSPDRFSGVLCQSAAFWWSDQRLVNEYQMHSPRTVRFRISCGSRETTEYVEHGPDLIQRTSQVASNRAMRDVLRNNGCEVSYAEFPGGHDIASWRTDLPESLLAILAIS